ncbi:MAG: hypothetical protein Q8P15_01840 [Nanoarchaeota archaeon]|nr:hypothetical protein [Nanoarchaeota archaeon]
MSKIKNAIKIGSVSALTLFGAENVLSNPTDPLPEGTEIKSVPATIFMGRGPMVPPFGKSPSAEEVLDHATYHILPKDTTKVDSSKTDLVKAKRNFLRTSNPWFRIEDGETFGLTLHNLVLTPYTNMSMDSLVNADLGDVHYKAMNAEEATRNIIKARQKRGVSTGNYWDRLKEIKKTNTLSDSLYNKSARILTKALENKIFSAEEDSSLTEVAEGIYALIPKNKDNSESGNIYIQVTKSKDKNPRVNIIGVESFLVGTNLNNYDPTGKDSTKDGSTPVVLYTAPQLFNKMSEPTANRNSAEGGLGLIVGAHAGQVNGVDLGAIYRNVALVANASLGLYENLNEITGPVSQTGMRGKVRTNNSNYKAVGALFEYHGEKHFIGAGVNLWNNDYEKEVIIERSNGTAKRDSEPIEKKSALAFQLAGGRKIKDNLYGKIKYDTNRGVSAGVEYHFGK